MITRKSRVSFAKRPRVDRYGSGLTRAWTGSGSSDSDPTALSGSGGAAAAHGGERRRGRRRQPKTASRARIRARVGLGARGGDGERGGKLWTTTRRPQQGLRQCMAEQELRRVILREGERGGKGKRGCGDPYFGTKLQWWSSSSGKRQTAARCEAPELGKSFKSGGLR